jgi:molybdenum cofactor cytidylyltransferase
VSVGAIVLAAGAGRRFGDGVKQLAEVDGRPLVEHAAHAVAAFSPRVVVLGHAASEIRAGADLHGAEVAVSPDWDDGQSASLRCGIEALGDVDAAVVVLADMPGITPAAVEAVVAAWDGVADAVRASYSGTPGHPVLLARSLLDRAGELEGDTGFRALLGDDARVIAVEAGHLADPADIDTPAQLPDAGICAGSVPPMVGSVLTGSGLTLAQAADALERGETPPLSAVQRRMVEEWATSR